ncbi:TetR/AcrR family transcriptional regulator [Desulfotruncus alcoholivorax]|uniref:TetR/AcrR family transcriptional regulator n=1 Tax=Desulfotruncus alcoholivorax TaxID=265477 RepID=UPI00041B5DCB|nr:TetR/AcrR family transcriptional regulator [Desulfotruncus alcoholivorax]
MSKERQLRKQEEIRNKILEVARDIVSKEGVQGLSIRKITSAIDYSPGIIYHYFKNKDEIVESLTSEGYKQILASVRSYKRNDEAPEEEIKEIFTNYIKAALAVPEEYKAFMLNDDVSVLKKTALLKKGISEKSPTLQVLCANIQRGMGRGRYAPCDPELTAQIIWTATFGLILKLMIEKDISQEQVDRLIEHHFNVIFNGIMLERKS